MTRPEDKVEEMASQQAASPEGRREVSDAPRRRNASEASRAGGTADRSARTLWKALVDAFKPVVHTERDKMRLQLQSRTHFVQTQGDLFGSTEIALRKIVSARRSGDSLEWVVLYALTDVSASSIESEVPLVRAFRIELLPELDLSNPHEVFLVDFPDGAQLPTVRRMVGKSMEAVTTSVQMDRLTAVVKSSLKTPINDDISTGPLKFGPLSNAPTSWPLVLNLEHVTSGTKDVISEGIERDNSEPPTGAERLAKERDDEVRRLLGELATCQAKIDETRHRMNDIVRDARTLSATWVNVGAALGITGQTAYQRFTDSGREKHRKRVRRQREGESGE